MDRFGRAFEVLAATALAVAFWSAPAVAALAPSPSALLARGQADQALAAIQQKLVADSRNAQALNLECRVFFSEERMHAAEAPCAQAVVLEPDNSSFHLWLGRVLGRQAEHASLLTAYGLAKKARVQFESAYQLDPHSSGAAADLAEFYTDAPGILGGGALKARAISDQLSAWEPSLAHSILAEIAEKAKDNATAEQQLRLAATSAGSQPADWIALASFYRKQGQVPAMLAALDKAIALDTAQDDALVSAAEQLIQSGQRPEEALRLLRTYLASPNQSEDAPAFQVRAQLAKLLAQSGDAASAQQQLAIAHALASGWQPDTRTGS